MPNDTSARPGTPKVPRDPADDYTDAMALRRREFATQQTGQALPHVGHYSIDPASLPGNVENFIGVAQVPIGLAGPLLIRGEHANGHFYVPLATTEGTLVASYNRGMRLITECGGVKTTVVEQFMQRSPVFVFDDALKAREFGSWVQAQFDAIKAAADATSQVGRLVNIYQYAVGPMRHLRFNYTTGDAAGQNMTGKATLAACEWITAHYPGGARYLLSGNMDTDKKHSQLNMLVTRGKRVVAECVLQREPMKRIMGVDTAEMFAARQMSNVGAFLGRVGQQRRARRQRPGGTVHCHGTGRRQRRRIARGYRVHAVTRQRRLLLVDHAAVADRRNVRWRHRTGDPTRVPRAARLLRQR